MKYALKRAVQSVSPEAIAAEISRLSGLPLKNLKAAWAAEFHREPPKTLWRDLLLRTFAWRLQERAFGGHEGDLRCKDFPEMENCSGSDRGSCNFSWRKGDDLVTVTAEGDGPQTYDGIRDECRSLWRPKTVSRKSGDSWQRLAPCGSAENGKNRWN
jgi:hypothetical protein